MVADMYERAREVWQRVLLAALVLVAAPRPARAADIWTAPYAGVRHLHRVGQGVDYHVLLVDLTNPAVSLVATRPGDRFTTTREFARRYDAQIAINANFFDHGSCGLAVGGGEVMDDAYEDGCRASIAFGRENEVALFDSALIPRGPLPAAWMTEVLSGKPFILRDGRVLEWVRPRHMHQHHPRTALGVTPDRRTLVVLVANGRRRGAVGLTGAQMAAVFQEFGASDAVNLDGGGSTTLVIDGRLRNHPADGRENAVVSHLGIRIRDDARWYAAEITGRGGPAVVRQDENVSLWIEARNLGRAVWRAADEGGGGPVLEVDDGVVGYVAGVRETTPPGAVARFEVRWQARGAGMRHLRARLRAPDGALLHAGGLGWDVAVERAPAVRRLRRPRVLVIAGAPTAAMPVGVGAVMVSARGCAAGPAGMRPRTWLALATGALWATRARRRRMR
jgi:hypothetical protein